MNEMKHVIEVSRYAVLPYKITAGTEKSYGFEKMAFTFSSEWDGLFKTVTFYPPRQKPISIEGIEQGKEYDVPAEVTSVAGTVSYSICGTAEGKRIFTVSGTVEVLDSTSRDGVAPQAPTPSEIEQIRLYALAAKEAAEEALAYLENAFVGEPGEDGGYYEPDVSEDGVLSWKASKEGMPHLENVNIKGPQGEPGKDGESIERIVGGSMAFKVLKVEKISDTETDITLDSVEGLQPGYLCSMDCGNNYNGFANVLGVIAESNIVAVDKYPDNCTVEEDSVFWIPDHPELGTTKIGEGAYNLGVNCKANQKGAFSTGEDNISDGKRSFTANRGNYAGYLGAALGSYNNVFAFNGLAGGNYNILYPEAINALLAGYMNRFRSPNGIGAGSFNWGTGENICVTGEYNTAGADNDLVGGEHSQSYYERCLLFGLYLLSGRVGQTIFGDYNAPNDRDILQIGVGTDENHRANAFIVDKNRNTIGGTGNNIQNIAEKFNIFMYGEGLWTVNSGEASLGRYNISTPQTVFTVGIGTADNARKNGLAVEKDGRVIIGADPVYAMDAATKQYVDTLKIPKITNVKPIGGEDLKANAFYDFGEVTAINVTLSNKGSYGDEYVNEHRFRFRSGSTATTLESILYNGATVKGMFTPEANRVYEVSIIDGYLTYQSWEV